MSQDHSGSSRDNHFTLNEDLLSVDWNQTVFIKLYVHMDSVTAKYLMTVSDSCRPSRLRFSRRLQ